MSEAIETPTEPTPGQGAPDNSATPAAKGDGEGNPNGSTPEPKGPKMVPEAVVAELRAKLRDSDKALQGFRDKEQAEKDELAKASGNVEAAQRERDEYAAEAKQWREYATGRVETLTEGLSDEQKGVLEALGDDVPLARRLEVAEKLTGLSQSNPQPSKKFGPSGGAGPSDPASVLPSSVHDGPSYHAYIAGLSQSHNVEDQLKLLDPEFNAAADKEARDRGFIA